MRAVPARAAVALLFAVTLLAGCGDAQQGAPDRPLGPNGLGRALELAFGAGRVPMHLTVTTTRPGRGTRPQFSADGELDLATRAGQATLHTAEAGGVRLPDLSINWTAAEVTASGGSMTRAQAHSDGGQLGMLPNETQALAELVRDAAAVREVANGRWTFTISPATAVDRGIPPQPEPGESWQGTAAAAADGRLRRVTLTLPTPALATTIPAGTARIELRLG